MKLKNIFREKTTISAKANVDGAEHDLNLDLESTKEIIYDHKIQFHCAIATTVEEKIDGRPQLVTAVSYIERALKRWQSVSPNMKNIETGEYLPWDVGKKFVTVFLDGNGDPVLAKYVLKNFIAQRRMEGNRYEYIYDETPAAGDRSYEATHDRIKDDISCDKKTVFDSGFSVDLPDWFIKKIEDIGKHDRENDVMFVYAIHSGTSGRWDQFRNALSLIPFPAAKATAAGKIIEGFMTAIGISNFVSSSKFIDHRAPVFLTKIIRKDYRAMTNQYNENVAYELIASEELDTTFQNAFEWANY